MVNNQPRYALTFWILNRYISTQIFSTELVNQNIQIYYHPAIIVRKVDSVDHPVTLSLKRNKQFSLSQNCNIWQILRQNQGNNKAHLRRKNILTNDGKKPASFYRLKLSIILQNYGIIMTLIIE